MWTFQRYERRGRGGSPARLGVFDPGRSLVLSFHQPTDGDPALPGIGVGGGAGIVEDGGAQTVRVKATLGAGGDGGDNGYGERGRGGGDRGGGVVGGLHPQRWNSVDHGQRAGRPAVRPMLC